MQSEGGGSGVAAQRLVVGLMGVSEQWHEIGEREGESSHASDPQQAVHFMRPDVGDQSVEPA